jgi:hypothetical protein
MKQMSQHVLHSYKFGIGFWFNEREKKSRYGEQYRFVAGLGFVTGWCLGFTLATKNFKSCGKLINHTKQALPA